MKDAIEQTGAVLMGRRTFEMADPDSCVGDYEFQVPIFVLTHLIIMGRATYEANLFWPWPGSRRPLRMKSASEGAASPSWYSQARSMSRLPGGPPEC
jgi:dihydrofolate reductase